MANRDAGARGWLGGPGQEHTTMTAEPWERPVTEAVRSLEVRWIFPGQLEAAVTAWFGRFPAGTESREDTYLLDPPLWGLQRWSATIRQRSHRAVDCPAGACETCMRRAIARPIVSPQVRDRAMPPQEAHRRNGTTRYTAARSL